MISWRTNKPRRGAATLSDLVASCPERPQIACPSSGDCSPGIAKVVSRCHSPAISLSCLTGVGRPRFICRTTEVTIKPLSEVDEAFAWDEGEGNRTRDWWLDAHRRYFARQATREGFEMDDEILAVFERFEVVWPLDVADRINGPTSAST